MNIKKYIVNKQRQIYFVVCKKSNIFCQYLRYTTDGHKNLNTFTLCDTRRIVLYIFLHAKNHLCTILHTTLISLPTYNPIYSHIHVLFFYLLIFVQLLCYMRSVVVVTDDLLHFCVIYSSRNKKHKRIGFTAIGGSFAQLLVYK